MSSAWPRQSQCDAFYGNPRGRAGSESDLAWEARNLVYLTAPWRQFMGATEIRRIRVHRRCAEAFSTWLNAVWENADYSQKTIDLWGMSVYSGAFAYRPMRGLSALSMHAYGCAVDFDAPRNGLHDQTPNFAKYRDEIVTPFLKLGGIWGGDWNGNGSSLDEQRCDGMHFQFAYP